MSEEEKINELKSQIEEIEADIKSKRAKVVELNNCIVDLRKEKRELEHEVFLLKNNSHNTFFLLVKRAVDKVSLVEVGTRKSDGTSTWAETREEFSSLEEAKLKLAAEGREARLLRDECLQASRKYMMGICVFSREHLFEMSDPI